LTHAPNERGLSVTAAAAAASNDEGSAPATCQSLALALVREKRTGSSSFSA